MQLPSPVAQDNSLPFNPHKPSLPGMFAAIAGEVGVVDLGFPVGESPRYGCVADYGVSAIATDNFQALNNWFASAAATGHRAVLWPGSYFYNGQLVWSVGNQVAPDVSPTTVTAKSRNRSVLVPGPLATPNALSLLSNFDSLTVEGIKVDGTLSAAGTTGVSVCDTPGTDHSDIFLHGVEVTNFSGLNSRGMKIANVVGMELYECNLHKNYVNAEVNGADSNLPTTVRFTKCRNRESTGTCGIKLVRADGLTFQECTHEANANQAILGVVAAGQTLRNVQLLGMNWFEANNAGFPAQYDVDIDGSAAGAYCSVKFRGALMNSSGGSPKSIHLKGVKDLLIDDVSSNFNAAILIDVGCTGYVTNPPNNQAQTNPPGLAIVNNSGGSIVFLRAHVGTWQALGLNNGWLNAAGGPNASGISDVNGLVRITGYITHAGVPAQFSFANLPVNDAGITMSPLTNKFIVVTCNMSTAPIHGVATIRSTGDLFLVSVDGGVNISEIFFDAEYRLDI